MFGMGGQVSGGRVFDDGPGIHNRDLVCQSRHQGQIVGNQYAAKPQPLSQAKQQRATCD